MIDLPVATVEGGRGCSLHDLRSAAPPTDQLMRCERYVRVEPRPGFVAGRRILCAHPSNGRHRLHIALEVRIFTVSSKCTCRIPMGRGTVSWLAVGTYMPLRSKWTGGSHY